MVLPKFIEALNLCKVAYLLAQEEYGCNRFNSREFEGALPKRKSLTKTIARIKKKADTFVVLSHHERRMVAAAYDQGLYEKHQAGDTE